ncbi:hypothetical protein FHG64_01390 [Antarcticibacterium flavum]|uniref:Serine/threonine protein kinase n=1 Tax=Antarcticibacterium flavum TaxID=2058175 RepID=A0A5B7WYA7_9FLAO|nr:MULTISPECIES: hypothetical protein [Antarcticibacterium]QCY68156.1 hypothetical protein FHG64_01390 [Antarcticibacterium flavum]
MCIRLNGASVIKTYKHTRGYKKRYKKEKAALNLLKDIQGIPALLDWDDHRFNLKMTCLPRTTPTTLKPEELAKIKNIITASLRQGVARHVLPKRDILCTYEGQVSIVDFERVTIKKAWDPLSWYIAKSVTLFHLNRLIFEHQPQLLSREEIFEVSLGFKVQKFFRKYMYIRDLIRNS